jgi:glutamine cyclotransferase
MPRPRPSKPVGVGFIMRPMPITLSLILLTFSLACSDEVSSVDNAPSCSIVSPAAGAVFAFGDTITVKAEASDPGGGTPHVEFYVNGTLWLVDSEPPYEYTLGGLAYRTGARTLTATAVNDAGRRTTDTVEVSVVSDGTPVYGARVINEFVHDQGAYTEGFLYDGGFFYESTGLWGQSSVRKVDVESGALLMIRRLPNVYFGEGIAVLGETLYQLTYRSGLGLIYNKADFDSLGSFTIDTEGWGMTTDGERLIMSNGTPTVRFLEASALEVTGEINVTDVGSPVTNVNELEYIAGDLFANIWYSRKIAWISLEAGEEGRVVGWVDLNDLARPYGGNVLNGIAYDSQRHRLFVTGKNWDKVYEIEVYY